MTRIMAGVLAGALAGALALTLPWAAEAAPAKKKYPKRAGKVVSDAGGSATARQRANSRAYERGDYYEQMSEAHVFGSRSWWYLKEREMSGGRN